MSVLPSLIINCHCNDKALRLEQTSRAHYPLLDNHSNIFVVASLSAHRCCHSFGDASLDSPPPTHTTRLSREIIHSSFSLSVSNNLLQFENKLYSTQNMFGEYFFIRLICVDLTFVVLKITCSTFSQITKLLVVLRMNSVLFHACKSASNSCYSN